MKKCIYLSCNLLIAAFGVAIFSGCATSSTAGSSSTASTSTTASADSGRLVIYRVANLGNLAILDVTIDGKKVAAITRGQTYTGALSAGPHVISVALGASNTNAASAEKRITVKKGQTYAFTVTYKSGELVLQ